MLEAKTIRDTSRAEKLKALEIQLNDLEKDYSEFREQLGDKGLRFILNEVKKVNMDICFISHDTENIKGLLKFFA